jgi:hypothetical protein
MAASVARFADVLGISNMKKEAPTLRGIAREILTAGYEKRAQRRAQRRKNPWNILLIVFAFAGAFLITYLLFQLMWRIHVIIYPAHVDRLEEFWSKGIGLKAAISTFLLLVPLFFASLPMAGIAANATIWLIPPARRAFEEEATGVQGASFHESMSGLWVIARVVVPVCLLLSFIGAATLASLR